MTLSSTPVPPHRSCLLITGATGLVGRSLVRELAGSGTPVIALSRDPRQASRVLDHPQVRCIGHLDELSADTPLTAIVHLAGARVLDKRWSTARREELLRSRAGITRQLLDLTRRLQVPPRVLVCASAVSYYGAAGMAPRTESDAPVGNGYASRLCVDVESAAAPACELGIRVVPLRLGIVLAREDGALPPLATASRLGLGAILGSGTQPVSWIHLLDAVGMIRLAIDQPQLEGALNAVAPETPGQADFSQAVAYRFGRRVRLRVPSAALLLLLGERAGLLLEGQVAVPRKALDSGFEFRFPRLAQALADLLPD